MKFYTDNLVALKLILCPCPSKSTHLKGKRTPTESGEGKTNIISPSALSFAWIWIKKGSYTLLKNGCTSTHIQFQQGDSYSLNRKKQIHQSIRIFYKADLQGVIFGCYYFLWNGAVPSN